MSIKHVLTTIFILVLTGLLLPITVQASQHRPLPANQTAQTAWTATVVVDRLNVRRAPRLTSNVVGKLKLSDKITLTGRNESGTWLQIQLGSGYGWVAHEFIRIDSGDSRYGLPIANLIPPSLVTTQGKVNVRLGPSELYPVVAQLPTMTDVDVIAFHRNPLWYEIAMPGDGPIGWVRGDTAMEVTGDARALPHLGGVPTAQIVSYRVHVHNAPLLNAPVIGTVGIGQFYEIVGVDSRRNWWQIKTPWGPGWILTEFVQALGSVETLPQTVAPPLRGQ